MLMFMCLVQIHLTSWRSHLPDHRDTPDQASPPCTGIVGVTVIVGSAVDCVPTVDRMLIGFAQSMLWSVEGAGVPNGRGTLDAETGSRSDVVDVVTPVTVGVGTLMMSGVDVIETVTGVSEVPLFWSGFVKT